MKASRRGRFAPGEQASSWGAGAQNYVGADGDLPAASHPARSHSGGRTRGRPGMNSRSRVRMSVETDMGRAVAYCRHVSIWMPVLEGLSFPSCRVNLGTRPRRGLKPPSQRRKSVETDWIARYRDRSGNNHRSGAPGAVRRIKTPISVSGGPILSAWSCGNSCVVAGVSTSGDSAGTISENGKPETRDQRRETKDQRLPRPC
jgi:hypothetical protein